MHCGGCDNIPFWRWLRKQTATSVTCNDYDGKSLSNLQPSNFTGCFREYLCTSFWKCYQINRKYTKNIDPFFYEEEFEDTKEVIRRRKSKDKRKATKVQIPINKKKKNNNRDNKRSSNTNTTKNRGWTQVLQKSAGPRPYVALIVLLLLHTWW